MNLPEMTPVDSSNIGRVGFENETVFVEFLNGSIYIYKGVPEHEFENLIQASSVGSYLHRNYKNVYPYERIQ